MQLRVDFFSNTFLIYDIFKNYFFKDHQDLK